MDFRGGAKLFKRKPSDANSPRLNSSDHTSSRRLLQICFMYSDERLKIRDWGKVTEVNGVY